MGKKQSFLFLIIFCVLFAAFASFYSEQLNRISLYIILPFAFLLSFFKNNLTLRTNRYVVILWCLFALIAFSALYATYLDRATRELKQILGVILISFVFAVNCRDRKAIPWLYFVYFMLYISVWYYAKNNILEDITFGEDRLDDNKLNANMMAYYTFYLTFAVFMLGEIIQKPGIQKMMRLVFFLTIPLSFIVAIYTASRQVFVIQIPLISILLYLRYLKQSKRYQKAFFILAVIAVSLIAIPVMMGVYENSLLQYRNEKEITTDIRVKLFRDALKVGFQHFFTGVGAGNYAAYSFDGHFAHNTFLELFANNGILGVSLFIYLMVKYLRLQYRRFKSSSDKMFLYFFWFGIMFSLDCMFYVMYSKIWLMGFFILVASHSEQYYQAQLETSLPIPIESQNEENSSNH